MSARQSPETFWARVERGDGCWEWQGSRNSHGYGRVAGVGTPGRLVLTHRIAWELTNGPVPEGLYVLHHCDNPPCVRPDHLFIGTLKDNSQDAAQKGRLGQAGRRLSRERLGEMGRKGAAALHEKHGADTARRGRAIQHERWLRGEFRPPAARFTNEQAAQIRRRYIAGESRVGLARELGVNPSTIHRIGKGRYYPEEPARREALERLGRAVG